MLYISRIREDEKGGYNTEFTITDSADGKERRVDMDKLDEAVFQYGLDIKGVVVKRGFDSYIDYVEVYQDPETITTQQIKLKVLQGIDLKLYKGEITSITANGNVTNGDAVVRLSDFGKSMCWCAQVGWDNHKGGDNIVMIIDDKIKMIGRVPRLSIVWAVWDIRELTNSALVRKIYKQLMLDESVSPASWDNYIRDYHKRMTFYAEVWNSGRLC